LAKIELQEKGDRAGLIATDDIEGKPELFVFVWLDRERRYFRASGSSMAEGTPVSRNLWRQITKDQVTQPKILTIKFPQPQATELYYDVCGKIDNHNRDRAATLGFE
jgi:hypothetical protein